MDVPLLIIKELKTKFNSSRSSMDGLYTKNGDGQWVFEERTREIARILNPNSFTKFLDDELKKYLRFEKIKKLNKKQKIMK